MTGLVGGIFGNPNDLATSLDLLIPLAVALGLTRRGLARAAYFACAAILAMGVVITFSRGGFLGLVAMAGMLLWKVGRRNKATTALAIMHSGNGLSHSDARRLFEPHHLHIRHRERPDGLRSSPQRLARTRRERCGQPPCYRRRHGQLLHIFHPRAEGAQLFP